MPSLKITRLSLVALALCASMMATSTPAIAQTADPAQIIRDRRDGLKATGAHLEAIAAIGQARGDTRPAVERVDAIIAFFANFPDRFPANTQAGDTRALPAVFTDRAGFTTAWNNLSGPLANLRTAAASGDNAAYSAALQQVGPTCGACHRAYRSR